MLPQYLLYLQSIKVERQTIFGVFLRFFEKISVEEAQQITEDFHEFYPVLRDESNLKERLTYYKNRSAIPDSGLMICLEEYFTSRLKSMDLNKI